MRRFVYLGIALGLAIGIGGLASLPACYNVPRPVCGFRCGPGEACPEDYTCSSFEERCHLNGSDPILRCDGTDEPDAMTDSLIDSIDAPADAVDAPGDTSDAPRDTSDAPGD